MKYINGLKCRGQRDTRTQRARSTPHGQHPCSHRVQTQDGEALGQFRRVELTQLKLDENLDQ